jgi:phenylalanyl-tRNA synthetase beta chain
MAREVAAIPGVRLQDPVKLERIPAEACPHRIEIEDLTLCPRYSALVFENVTVQPSPAWLQYRLEAIGLNPINNIVDVTNWILAELAQPMHAFDAGLLHGDTIFIRRARQGEWIVALNEETYKLDPQAQVIADEKGPIALAGVIGGLDTAIHEGTKRVVLESANFQASNIRKTSSRLKLRTDASMRFEKAQDPANTVRGIARAIELFEMVSPGIRIVGGLGDVRREEKPAPRIELPVEWVERKLGRPLDGELITRILRSLEFGVREAKAGVLSVSVPSWRATKDIAIKDDLVEEVGRMVGYDSITPSAPLVAAAVPAENPERTYLRSVRALMAAEGFTEVYNYSFVSDDLVSRFDLEPSGHVAIANPIASDQNYMRTSLIPNIWRNLENNSRHFETFRLFEIGREIHKQAGEELPREVTHLVAAMYARHAEDAGLYELKRVAECLLPGARVAPTEARSYEHPARAAEVIWQDRAVGRLFELYPRMLTGRAAILDIDLALVESLQPAVRKYQPIRRYPSSGFDLSVIVRTRELVGEVQDRLARATGTELESIEFLRQYAGPPIEEGYRSVSYRITVASPDHTLSLEEVGHIRARIIEDMRAAGYELRV